MCACVVHVCTCECGYAYSCRNADNLGCHPLSPPHFLRQITTLSPKTCLSGVGYKCAACLPFYMVVEIQTQTLYTAKSIHPPSKLFSAQRHSGQALLCSWDGLNSRSDTSTSRVFKCRVCITIPGFMHIWNLSICTHVQTEFQTLCLYLCFFSFPSPSSCVCV